VVIDAYDGTTTFYVFDTEDPIIAAYRQIFPSLRRNLRELDVNIKAMRQLGQVNATPLAGCDGVESTDLPKARLMASRARNGEGKRKLFQLRPIY
jgi:hypothetical protein